MRAVLDFWRPKPGEKAPDLQALLAAAVEGYGAAEAARRQGGEARRRPSCSTGSSTCSRPGASRPTRSPPSSPPPVPPARRRDASGRSPTRSTPGAACEALQRVRREVPEDFAALAEAFKRAKNILAQQAPAASVDPKLFEADAERALFEAASGLEKAAGSYEDRLRGLASLRAPVGRFFDDVLVMAEDARVRANRLALLDQTLSLFYRIADISSLGGTS